MSRELYRYHPRVGRTYLPNLRARLQHESGGYLLATNPQGFRCRHDFAEGQLDDRKRVLLFGDSFTAGDGVSDKVRYSNRLEEEIERLDVFNFGMPGTGTDQHFLIFEEFAQDLSCDCVVIAVQVENLRRVAAQYRPFRGDKGPRILAKPYFILDDGELMLHNVPVPVDPIDGSSLDREQRSQLDSGGKFCGLRTIIRQLGLKEFVQRLSSYQPVPQYDDPQHPAWLLMRAILIRWINKIEAPVILMPIPLYQYVEGTADATGYQSRFAELAEETGTTLHDPLTDLASYPASERRGFRFKHDVHLTPTGHAALARSLAPTLRVVLGKRTSHS